MTLITWVGAHCTIRDKPFSFKGYHFLRDLYWDQSKRIIVMKASQMGFSEWCVNTALWFADTKGGNVLYTMPTQTQMDDFSKARIKSRIDVSDYLTSLMASMDRYKGVDNVRLRKLRKAYLY
jgi:phage terminase large subunit GpA-like protein